MTPGGKPHPVDRVLEDGEAVTLGGSTLIARHTPGHTPGCTTWTLTVEEGGESYDVVIVGSMGSNPGFQFVNNPSPSSMRSRLCFWMSSGSNGRPPGSEAFGIARATV